MSEGTMQRAVKRLNRAVVCAAAVPVMFLAAACSSGSGSSDGAAETPAGDAKGSTSASASPTVQAAAYGKLPEACKALSGKTLGELVPKGAKSGKGGTSSDVSTRGSCSWNSLDNNGVKGSQFRWLNVSLLRFESDPSRGAGDKQAGAYYQKQVRDAGSVTGAKNSKSQPLSGTGDEATAIRYDLKKKEGTFKQQTVVARVENVVVTLDYNGAGLAGDGAPDAAELAKDAEKAAREVVAAVAEANGHSGASKPGKSPSGSASGSPSKQASPSASKSPAKSASPSASKN
ncbi:DUF3558 domain-containing protein [Streptomyces sp. NPDC086766]|uniref:DUF3558 domain-containing protein n=1 Tax=Streptomyces sp. NPDC086766 TaxID=3365754 RepID=UPI00382DDBDC